MTGPLVQAVKLISRYFEKAQKGDTEAEEDEDEEEEDKVPPAYLPLPDATLASLKVPAYLHQPHSLSCVTTNHPRPYCAPSG